MVVLLKALCFALWMLIMVAMIVGSRYTTAAATRKVYADKENSKMTINRAWAKK